MTYVGLTFLGELHAVLGDGQTSAAVRSGLHEEETFLVVGDADEALDDVYIVTPRHREEGVAFFPLAEALVFAIRKF